MSTLVPEIVASFERLETAGETAGGRFVALHVLESGDVLGLARPEAEAAPRWVLRPADGAEDVLPTRVTRWVEVLEVPRPAFEEELERRAKELGFPGYQVVLSFPALAIIEVMLTKKSAHLVRLGLEWALPSELRVLRAAIQSVADNRDHPDLLRSLARRLVVPDAGIEP